MVIRNGYFRVLGLGVFLGGRGGLEDLRFWGEP